MPQALETRQLRGGPSQLYFLNKEHPPCSITCCFPRWCFKNAAIYMLLEPFKYFFKLDLIYFTDLFIVQYIAGVYNIFFVLTVV